MSRSDRGSSATVRVVVWPSQGGSYSGRWVITASTRWLATNGTIKDPVAFHDAVFVEYHQRSNRLGSKDAIQTLFARFDVSADEFERAWSSFEVDQKMRVASDLARRYGIASVPAIVVNGKYRTGAAEAGGNDALLVVIDELVAREEAR